MSGAAAVCVTLGVWRQVTSCPADAADWTQELVIQPLGLNEELRITMNMICECDCEKPGQGVSACRTPPPQIRPRRIYAPIPINLH